jgi:predicted AAA+ superfamily ATPase
LHISYILCYNVFHDFICGKIGKSKKKYCLFFDEIQEVDGWEKAVNSLRVKFNADIYITGSNSKLLSGELATHIAGRYVSFVVYPFSFQELKMLNTDYTFDNYLEYGGMPFLSSMNFEPEISKNYLKDVFNSIVLKDIVKREKIRDVDLLERIISYALANEGKPFSATGISKFFKSEKRTIAPETILNYLKACEEAFLLYRLKNQDINGKKLLKVNEKHYVADHGLREAVCGANLKNAELVLENIACIELLRRGYAVYVGRVNGKEIDFVGEKHGEKIYLQICYILGEEKTLEREFRSLLEIKDNYPKLVLYKESSFSGNFEGIPAIKMEDWLTCSRL